MYKPYLPPKHLSAVILWKFYMPGKGLVKKKINNPAGFSVPSLTFIFYLVPGYFQLFLILSNY